MSERTILWGAGAALALMVLGYLFIKNSGGAQGAGAAVGKAAGSAAAGVVLGIGDSAGVPRTDATECDRALAEGRLWDASFKCPAGRFIREGLLGKRDPIDNLDMYRATERNF
jgi:hypothetical protein